MEKLLRLVNSNINALERVCDQMILKLIGSDVCSPSVALTIIAQNNLATPMNPSSCDPMAEGFAWGVPKSRRSREKRMTRRFGSVKGYNKMLVPKKLLTCDHCGHAHEAGRLCPNCYAEAKTLTEAVQEAMAKTQGLHPIEHEVIPVFKGEKLDEEEGFYMGKRIVEVEKPRPKWFSQNLIKRSTVTTSSDTALAKPTNLA
ncbi:mitochondrial ribosomal protein L32 [Oratosquilla oratoria]|uniref:mitochondrial ribosomal protein L32 n=1 Tax=Oratosquilla oratoria TaxID=337810 RepID=UPI003F762FCE